LATGSPEEKAVTKKEIVRFISDELNLSQQDVKKVVQKTFDAVIDALAKEGRIELRNFGVFEVKERKARKARNPRTGEEVFVASKRVVTFKPGKEMEQIVGVNGSENETESEPPAPAQA
jgi:DNA-binding protein HU-beta/integration host factor subunit beta